MLNIGEVVTLNGVEYVVEAWAHAGRAGVWFSEINSKVAIVVVDGCNSVQWFSKPIVKVKYGQRVMEVTAIASNEALPVDYVRAMQAAIKQEGKTQKKLSLMIEQRNNGGQL